MSKVLEPLFGQKGSPGYIEFPNGQIMQWGQTPILNNSSSVTTSFPIAFPNSCSTVVVSDRGDPVAAIAVTDRDVNGFDAKATDSSTNAFYIAIGH